MRTFFLLKNYIEGDRLFIVRTGILRRAETKRPETQKKREGCGLAFWFSVQPDIVFAASSRMSKAKLPGEASALIVKVHLSGSVQ